MVKTEQKVACAQACRCESVNISRALNLFLHPFRWELIVKQLHGEVERGVDEEVGHDEGEDVGGRVGKHDVAVWL